MVGFFCQVDKHIRRLDGDLSRFEQELQMKDPGARRLSVTSPVDLQSPAQSRESDKWTVNLPVNLLAKSISQLVGTASLVPRLSPANPNPLCLYCSLWCRGEPGSKAIVQQLRYLSQIHVQ